MKIYEEKSLSDFEFWPGAQNTANILTPEQMEEIESSLKEICPDGIDRTKLNNIFLFAGDTIAEWLGFDSLESLKRYNNGEAEG